MPRTALIAPMETTAGWKPSRFFSAVRFTALSTGSSLHGFVDGIVVAGAFQVSGSLGWLAAGAVLLHEIPQEAGSMALVKSLGWPRGRTIAVFLIPAASTLAGGAAGSLFLSHSAYLPHVLAASAASFLFITLRSFLPEVMSAERSRRGVVADILLFLAGVGTFCSFSRAWA